MENFYRYNFVEVDGKIVKSSPSTESSCFLQESPEDYATYFLPLFKTLYDQSLDFGLSNEAAAAAAQTYITLFNMQRDSVALRNSIKDMSVSLTKIQKLLKG